jgi:murein DD-endopeptidase MepM/ murein hydrolase activator NlpD
VNRIFRLSLYVSITIFTLTGCNLPQTARSDRSSTSSPLPLVAGPVQPLDLVVSATGVILQETHSAQPLAATQCIAPSPLPDPLEFVFPTAGPQPISLWRPPLYPTPWEPTPNDHFLFTRPIGADAVNWPLSRYRYGYLFYAEPHTGVDIPAPKGTPIMAIGPGTVTYAGYGIYYKSNIYADPYGIAVSIRHDFGFAGKEITTVYGHMDKTFVYRGQHVEGGEVIGIVGETGKVSGPHLHLEVRLGDETFFATRNPELWIAPPQGWGVLVGQLLDATGDKLTKVKVKLRNLETNQIYEAISYAEGAVNSDDYYKENLELGDLPAGKYFMYLDHPTVSAKTELEIRPGQVTFFLYRFRRGFEWDLPPAPGPKFIPPDFTPTVPGLKATQTP